MNQKEEIRKEQATLEVLTKKRDKMEAIFEKEFGETNKAIAKYNKRIEAIYGEIDKIKQTVASTFSSNPSEFIRGSYGGVHEELMKKAEEIGANHHDCCRAMWDRFRQIVDQNDGIKKLEKERESLRKKIDSLQTSAWQKSSDIVKKAREKVQWSKNRIDWMSDIGQFRQYAKEIKHREQVEKRRAEKDAKRDEFMHWFEKEHLQ